MENLKDKFVVTFGEIMLRLSPPEKLRFTQTDRFMMEYGGGEANVAVGLAQLGVSAKFATALPPNDIGEGAVNFLRKFGVDTSLIARTGSRIGIYFLEHGAIQRPSKVVYDRAGSALAEIEPGSINWKKALKDASWFHWTGITPAVSQRAADECLNALKTAKDLGIPISADMNYRKKLWNYVKNAAEVMTELYKYVEYSIGNEEDADKVFGVKAPDTDVERGVVDASKYEYVGETLFKKFPNLKKAAITLRGSISASHNTWSGILYNGSKLHVASKYDIFPIVDRVGGGDSFAAGLIYSLLAGKSDQEVIEFAVASSCLKHTIYGDFNLVSAAEVENLIKSGGGGRIVR